MQIATYTEAREYLESFIRPTVTARLDADSKLPHPLRRMQVLLELLGNPHHSFRSVQISGTSGKGSTSYLLAHLLKAAGYKTGLTISPHLQKLNERIQIENQPITDENFVALLNEVRPAIEQMKKLSVGSPSYFEILIAMAFKQFALENVDIAVVEVGLEGKLDGTNVLKPLIGVITNIDLDHTEILGETIEQIAEEALSIIQTGEHIVSGIKQPAIQQIIRSKCLSEQARLSLLGTEFSYEVKEVNQHGSYFTFSSGSTTYSDIELNLVGEFQVENATIALEVVRGLKQFSYNVSEEQMRDALKTAVFPGRFEMMHFQVKQELRNILLDGAHNPVKMLAFLSSLERLYPDQKKIFIVTFKKGKDASTMLKQISKLADQLILTEFHRTIDTSKNASLTIHDLAGDEAKLDLAKERIQYIDSSHEALKRALSLCQDDDLIIVTGSLYLVGEIRDELVRDDSGA